MFFYCFNIHFWSFSTFKNKHFDRDVFQISKVVRVLSSSPFETVFGTDFGAKFASFWASASMHWECFFFTWFSMRFGTLFGAPNESKNGHQNLLQVTIITYCAPDGCSDSFLTPPGPHFGRFGSPFLVDFGSRLYKKLHSFTTWVVATAQPLLLRTWFLNSKAKVKCITHPKHFRTIQRSNDQATERSSDQVIDGATE